MEGLEEVTGGLDGTRVREVREAGGPYIIYVRV